VRLRLLPQFLRYTDTISARNAEKSARLLIQQHSQSLHVVSEYKYISLLMDGIHHALAWRPTPESALIQHHPV
jgi:hypothetical protein